MRRGVVVTLAALLLKVPEHKVDPDHRTVRVDVTFKILVHTPPIDGSYPVRTPCRRSPPGLPERASPLPATTMTPEPRSPAAAQGPMISSQTAPDATPVEDELLTINEAVRKTSDADFGARWRLLRVAATFVGVTMLAVRYTSRLP